MTGGGTGLRRGTKAKRESIIPRLAVSSLTTPDFRWLYAEAWNQAQMAAFQRLRQGPATGMFRPPPESFGARARHAEASICGRWLYAPGPGDEVLIALEAQAFFRNFRIVHAVVCAEPGVSAAAHRDAISLMISGLLIMTRADLVVLLGDPAPFARELGAFQWGEARAVWSPSTELAHFDDELEHGLTAQQISLDPTTWWASPHGEADRATLAYLEKRMDLDAKIMPKRRQRRSLASRLGRFLRWS